ncbi:MAG: PAS domain S-box protein [Armatimonadia bacterium]|nr:PAS domain S-box protein [Armatimonadia bacterium]
MPTDITVLAVGVTPQVRGQIADVLRNGPFDAGIDHVADSAAMRQMLTASTGPILFDLVVCNHDLSSDCIGRITRLLAASGIDAPLIVLSDSDDAEAAVEAMRAGADDWIITHHLPQRLIPSIEHALRDRRSRREAADVAAALEDSRRQYHELAEALPQVVFEIDTTGRFTFVNERGLEMFGYTHEDLERNPHVSTILVEEDRPLSTERIKRMLSGESLEEGAEFTIVRSDGTTVPGLVHSAPIRRQDEIVGVRGIFVDMREIKATQEQLRASEERHRRLVESMGDGLVTITPDGTITFANHALAEMFDSSVDRIVGRDVRELLEPGSSGVVRQQLQRRFSAGASGSYEIEAQTLSGRPMVLLVTGTPLRDENGRIVASLGVVKDITHQRQAQESLLRIKTAVDNASDAIGMADSNRVPVYLNPAFVEMFGCTVEELREAGGPRANFVDEDEYHRVFGDVEERGSFVGEFEGRHSSGRTFPVMGRVDSVHDARGQLTGYVAVFSDITARRQREERQRLTTARLSLVNRLNQMLNAGESVDDIIAAGADGLRDILSAHHVHIFMRRPGEEFDELHLRYSNMPNDAEKCIFGGTLDGVRIVMPLHPEMRSSKMYRSGEPVEVREEQISSTIAEIQSWADPAPIIDGPEIARKLGVKYLCLAPLMRRGEALGHVTVSRCEDRPLSDLERSLLKGFTQQMAVILDKARSEQEIARLNHFLEGIIDNAAVWFMVVDEDDELIIWNRAAEEITGYSRDEIESAAHLMRLMYPDDEDRRRGYQYVMAARAGEDMGAFETTITRADGGKCRIAWQLRRFITADGGTGLIVLARDVTESRELQEQLRRVQRMDAVGTLAGGIAHDFNNVLTAIVGHADLLSVEADEGSRERWHATEISRNAARASRLTRQLLAFSRKQPSRPQVVDLNRLVRDMEEMFRRVIPENIDLQLDLTTDLGYTEIDPSQVEQIVMNLVLNARDAMPDGGELRITTTNATLEREQVSKLFDAGPGSYVTLQVYDTGVGMDEETEAHIFEPFFTTKQEDGGTGLGLSTVYGLVRQNEGAITVYSEVNRGSLFRIYLPRADSVAEVEGAEEESYDQLEGTEQLLVVEDADSLRDLIGTMLTSFGYDVLLAAGGAEAIKIERQHRDEIALVISDVVMPEMSGTELADRLLEASPGLRVLFISGYPSDRAVTAQQTDDRFSFMQKPFSAIDLGRKVREILDGQ